MVRELGAELGLDVVDLNSWTRALYAELGEEGSKDLFFHFSPGEHAHWAGGLLDDTHFHERGARQIARFVAARLEVLGFKPEPDLLGVF